MNWQDRKDFAAIILTHGRAGRVDTIKTFRESGFRGRFFLLIDDEDKQGREYKKEFGDAVRIFNKSEAFGYTDTGDSKPEKNVVVFARNAVYEIARKEGLRYIMVLDDDYTDIQVRFTDKKRQKLGGLTVKNISSFIDASFEFLLRSGVAAVAWGQTGDLIGGIDGIGRPIRNKVMNVYFFDIEKPLRFMGRLNEDLTASVESWKNGKPLFTLLPILIQQRQTQSNAGGLTDSYLDNGTYVKSFYSVMWRPDCVSVAALNSTNSRIHHRVDWVRCCPKIIREKYKK